MTDYLQEEQQQAAKDAFYERVSDFEFGGSPDGAFKTLLHRSLVFMGHSRVLIIQGDHVLLAAKACGFVDLPSPLRHNMKNREEFETTVERIFNDTFHIDPTIEPEAFRLLNYFFETFEDESSKYTVKEVEGGLQQKVTLDSPRGIHAEFFQTNWDFFDNYAYYEDDDDTSYVAEKNHVE